MRNSSPTDKTPTPTSLSALPHDARTRHSRVLSVRAVMNVELRGVVCLVHESICWRKGIATVVVSVCFVPVKVYRIAASPAVIVSSPKKKVSPPVSAMFTVKLLFVSRSLRIPEISLFFLKRLFMASQSVCSCCCCCGVPVYLWNALDLDSGAQVPWTQRNVLIARSVTLGTRVVTDTLPIQAYRS